MVSAVYTLVTFVALTTMFNDYVHEYETMLLDIFGLPYRLETVGDFDYEGRIKCYCIKHNQELEMGVKTLLNGNSIICPVCNHKTHEPQLKLIREWKAKNTK